jgi:uncharacterized membrane protein
MSKPVETKFVAFVAAMGALSNVLGFIVVPVGPMTFHLIQLPIVFSGLAVGPLAGGLVGFFGAFVMAFTLSKPNPYIVVGNAILGFLTGTFYSKLRHMSRRSILPQVISVVLAYALQMPYVYVTDVYLMGMPSPVVLGILVVLLVEDVISTMISHVILYRVNINEFLSQH